MRTLWNKSVTIHDTIKAEQYVPREAFERKPSLIYAETGTGKTTAAIEYALSQTEYSHVFIALPTVAHVKEVELKGDRRIHCAYGNRAPTAVGCKVTVGTYDKAYKCVVGGISRQMLLICDEVHKLSQAVTYRDTAIELNRSIPSEWSRVIGLSGTPQVAAEYFLTNVLRVETPQKTYAWETHELKSESDGLIQLATRIIFELGVGLNSAFVYLPSAVSIAKLRDILMMTHPELSIVCISSSRSRRDDTLIEQVCGTKDRPVNWDVCIGTNYVEEGLSVYHSREVISIVYTPGRTLTDPTSVKQFAARVRTNEMTKVVQLVKYADAKVRAAQEDQVFERIHGEAVAAVENQRAQINQRTGRCTDKGKIRRETQYKGEVCIEKIEQQVVATRFRENEDRYSYDAKRDAVFHASRFFKRDADELDASYLKEMRSASEIQSEIANSFRARPLGEILRGIADHCQSELYRAIIEQEILSSALFRDLVDLRNLMAADELSPWHENCLATEQEKFLTIAEWAGHPETDDLLREWTWQDLRELGHETRGEGLRAAIVSWFARGDSPRDRFRQTAYDLVKRNLSSAEMRERLSVMSQRDREAVKCWLKFDRGSKKYAMQPVEHISRWAPFLPIFASQLTTKSALWKPTQRLKPLLIGGKNAVVRYLTMRGLLQIQVAKSVFIERGFSWAPAVWLDRAEARKLAERDAANPTLSPWILGGVNEEGEELSREAVLAWLQMPTPNTPPNADPVGEITGGGGTLIPQFSSGAFAETKENWGKIECKAPADVQEARSYGVVRANGERTKPLNRFAFAPDQVGVVVLDLDIKNGKNGLNSLNAIAAKLGCEPIDARKHPCVVRTPSGGYHLYFKAPKGKIFQSNVAAEGVDVFHANKMLTAPGSSKYVENELKDYTLHGSIADAPVLPEWIEGLLDAAETSYEREAREQSYAKREFKTQLTPDEICDRVTAKRCGYSGRNEACAVLAFTLAKAGFDETTIRDCLQTRPETSGHDRMRYTIRYAIRRANRA